jgi:hypothetical protein
MCWQACGILAPVVGGFLLAHLDLDITFGFHFYSIALWCLRDFPQIQTESVTQSLKEALQFIFKTKIIFWAMFLDLGSVFLVASSRYCPFLPKIFCMSVPMVLVYYALHLHLVA